MKQFYTSVVELDQEFDRQVTTQPFEVAWADEAIFFVESDPATPPSTRVELRAQISPDGLRWIDEGTSLDLAGAAHRFVRLTHFGGFLRLSGTVTSPSDSPACILTIRLALKG